MESSQYIVNHYSNYDEESRLTGKSGSVELITTMRYIEKYIKHGDRVLEIGAATGRYSHALARQGKEKRRNYHKDTWKQSEVF